MNLIAQPETAAESGIRIAGLALAIAGAVELYGLYGMSNPTHWLANLGISIGDGSFRTLSMAGIAAVAIGGGLYLRQGLYLILAGVMITLAIHGYGKWYTFGASNSVSQYVSTPTTNAATPTATATSTGAAMTAAQKAWCAKDDDEDGVTEPSDSDGMPNWKNSQLAHKNCTTGIVHTAP